MPRCPLRGEARIFPTCGERAPGGDRIFTARGEHNFHPGGGQNFHLPGGVRVYVSLSAPQRGAGFLVGKCTP